MSYYIAYDGIDLSNTVGIRNIEMPLSPSMEHSSINVFERDGNIFNGSSYNNRQIKLTLLVHPTNEEYQTNPNIVSETVADIKRIFCVKEPRPLYLGDDSKYMMCVPTGEITANEIRYDAIELEITLIAYNPFWHSDIQNIVNNEDEKIFTVENESDVPVYPIMHIGLTKPTSFVQIENNGEKILIGGIPSVENDTILANESILVDEMESTSGWVATSAPIDPKRTTGGNITTTADGFGLCVSSLPSGSDGSWKGACYKKQLTDNVKDFQVRVRMEHASTGQSGDPSKPYSNDSSGGTTTGKTTYYKVTASGGLRLRKKASTNSTKLCTIPKGTKLYPTSISNGWAKVTYNGKTGYCSTKYLKKYTSDSTSTSSEVNMVVTHGVNIRSSASSKSTIKGYIPAGNVVRVNPTKKNGYYKMVKSFNGAKGYVYADYLVKGSKYEVDYEVEPETSDDKTGCCSVYGFSSNNVQLFKLELVDDNEYYEFTYPRITKNGKDFLVDKTVAPDPKTITTYDGDSKKVETILSGAYGDWNDMYGELYIERVDNQWSAYVQRIKDGEIVKEIKSKTVIDTTNSDEELSYLVIYMGSTQELEKCSDMCVSFIEVKTATQIDKELEFNFQEMTEGDIITIDCSVPSVYLNDVECPSLVDVGSSFFALDTGENTIKIASDDNPNVDILWNNKYL